MNLPLDIPLGEFLGLSIWGNTIQDYLIYVGITLVVYLFFSVIITFGIKKFNKLAERTKTKVDDMIVKALRRIKWPLFLIILLITTPTLLTVHENISTFSRYAIIVVLTYEAIRIASLFLDFGVERATKKEGSNQFLKPFSTIIKIALWLIGAILILSNFGYDVTSLIAGLGIGGIAIALALQNVLSDIFSSLSIYFDKPFKVGDFIIVGDKKGEVKSIGIKTTRVISIVNGEELVIPNNTLVNTEVQNYGKMKERRIAFSVGVTYETPLAKVKKAKKIIEEIIKKQKKAKFERVFFTTLGDSALIFETVYYVKSGEFKDYGTTQEKINLGIMEAFEKEGIHFAYPTQTLHVVGDSETN